MPRIPTATYRLQLHADFGFDAAASIADYLHDLGVSHVYSSPYLQAAPGSKHGYDVVDHHKVNEELGGPDAHSRFAQRLGECHLGQVLDIVPNHMAISGRRNRLWWDVLENGPASRYASHFDIDWQPHEEKLRNKLLVPILGDHYGRVIDRGEIQVRRKGGEFYVSYYDNELPAAPRSLPLFILQAAEQSGSDYLAFLGDSLNNLPRATAGIDFSAVTQRHRDKEVIANLLERLFNEVPFIAESVDTVLKEVNKDPNRLHEFLELQNYRLAFWRTAEQDLGYRRFFDVNTLVGLRMEDPRVFKDAHALILRWLREGVLDGIRVDHPDGLCDVRQYFQQLREEAPDVWILGEKILEPGEELRKEWPIDGTTGYEFANEMAGVFVDGRNEGAFNELYTKFSGEPTDYFAVCRDKKHRVLRDLLGSDVNRLTTLFTEICEHNRERRDYTRHDVIRAIREVVACFPVYRTYIVPARDEITPDDIRYVNEAIEAAKANRPEIEPDLFDFLRDVMLLKVRGNLEAKFVMRFQQFTGPAMAKGVEDTVFYDYNRLIALNEVGGDPGRFGVSTEQFHEFCANVQKNRPKTMLGSSTHDTKRSEDVRARLSLLSEMPAEWEEAVNRWSEMNQHFKKEGFPDRNTEYFLYQTMLGAWPIGPDRLLPYMEKAIREGKQNTSWLSPNAQFEAATKEFVEQIYASEQFKKDFEKFVSTLIELGWINSLSQSLLKFTCPGIPDIYQGCEIWDLSLVDPDNRRPIDYEWRRKLLRQLKGMKVEEVRRHMEDGLPKLWTTYHALRTRREWPEAFSERGDYIAIQARGEKAEHVIAFQRGEDVVVVVPRLVKTLANNWGDTEVSIASGQWTNELTGTGIVGGKIRVKELLSVFPVALLVKV